MLILILINIQYVQNIAFSFEKGLTKQNNTSSDSYHLIFPPTGVYFSYFLMLFGQPWWEVPCKHQKHGRKRANFAAYLLIFSILTKVNATELFVVWAVGKVISGSSLGKIIIIIHSLRVIKSKSKNIDHWGKESCA